jgi:hypothetical protein
MEHLSNHEDRMIEPTSPSAKRKAYAAPHLLEYGSVAKLTQGTTGSGTDTAMTQVGTRRSPKDAPAKMR